MPLECPTILDFACLQAMMATETVTTDLSKFPWLDGGIFATEPEFIEVFAYPVDDWRIIRTALLCLATANIACAFTSILDVWYTKTPSWTITEIIVSIDHVYVCVSEGLSIRARDKWAEEIQKLGQIPDSMTITFIP